MQQEFVIQKFETLEKKRKCSVKMAVKKSLIKPVEFFGLVNSAIRVD